jgi:SAM-dependent methyltransferase
MPGSLRLVMPASETSPWHELPVQRIRELGGLAGDHAFVWHDVGAGAGEMARLMSSAFPKAQGVCTDLHARPASLSGEAGSILWMQADLNDEDFGSRGAPLADVVYATGVWEHVRNPRMFVRNLLQLLKPHGLLYLICPNVASLAFRVLGARWPYFSPGEHLHMPTPEGARACLRRELKATGRVGASTVTSRPIAIPYKLNYVVGYVAAHFGWARSTMLFPASLALPLPTGALETWARV